MGLLLVWMLQDLVFTPQPATVGHEYRTTFTDKATCSVKDSVLAVFIDPDRTIAVKSHCVHGHPKFEYWVSKTSDAEKDSWKVWDSVPETPKEKKRWLSGR